jgi:geranylgeranyl diphosphate synthase, type II
MVDLSQEMVNVKARVDRLILEEILPKSSPIHEVDILYKMMRDYPERPAKGLRPFICITACRAMGGKEADAMLTAACLEIFQHWILIHDDIEDGSEMRRGQPTLHRRYSEALALNAGDALHAKMWEVLAKNRATLGPEKTLQIISEFSRMVDHTTEGQHMELVWVTEKNWDLDESDYEQMVIRKTSWYTVASPCRLGAMVAGATESDLENLLQFGLKLGIGFQIQDDALNLVGDQSKYGKALSDDLLEGKRTMMLLKLLKVAKPDERQEVVSIMNKPRSAKTPADVERVLSLMKRYDTIGYAQKRAAELLKEALVSLHKVKMKGDRQSVEMLESVARFAIERQW